MISSTDVKTAAVNAHCKPPGSQSLEVLVITHLPVSSLKEFPNNPRTHTKAQIRKIAESIRAFGFNNPVIIDSQSTIIAGHGRVRAAKLIGLEQVPTIRLSSLSPAQIRAYVIADNRLCLDAGWNEEILKIELQNLIALDEVDISLTGFETAELDLILNEGHEEYPHDDLAELTGPAITQPGDLWQLDGHRILCGDATLASSFVTLMDGKQAAVVFTDAPYNVAIHGHASGNGRVRHDEFAMASGEMSKKEFQEFLTTVFTHLAHSSANGSVHYLCMDWRSMAELLAAGEKVYESLLNLCIWCKDKGGMGSFIAHSMSAYFYTGMESSSIATIFSSAVSGAIGRMSGSTPVPARCRVPKAKRTCWRCTQP